MRSTSAIPFSAMLTCAKREGMLVEGMIWTAGIRRGNVLTAKMHGMSTSALTVINVIPNFSAVSTFSQSRGVPCAGCDMASCPCPSARCPRKCWDHCANVLVPPKQRGPMICSAHFGCPDLGSNHICGGNPVPPNYLDCWEAGNTGPKCPVYIYPLSGLRK